MDKSEGSPVDVTRRNFLVAAGGIGTLGAVAFLSGRKIEIEQAAPLEPAAQASSGGYRETEHIRKYYRTAGYW